MKKYILTIDRDPKNFYRNTLETVWIQAANYKDAVKRGRSLARDYNSKFVTVRLVK